jgi:hypothetical protein
MDAKEKDMKKRILNKIIKLYDLWFVLLILTCIISQAYIKTYHKPSLLGLLLVILFTGLYLSSSSAKNKYKNENF